MRWGQVVLRILGWLLTPLVAWAASFCGASLGTEIALGISRPMTGVWVTVGTGALAGLLALLGWVWLLGRSPRLRHSLHLTAEGLPEELVEDTPEGLPDAGAPPKETVQDRTGDTPHFPGETQ